MLIEEAISKVESTEKDYRMGPSEFTHTSVKEEDNKLMVQLEGNWVPMNGMTRTLCKALRISESELKKFPLDAQVYSLKAKLRVPTKLEGLFYKGHPVAMRPEGRNLCPMSRFLKLMKDWKGWDVKHVVHEPMRALLHTRMILTDKFWDYRPDDRWFAGIDLFQDYAEGVKLGLRAMIMRQVCTNGLVRVYRTASLEGRYDPTDEESIKKALAQMMIAATKQWDRTYSEVVKSGQREVTDVTTRFERLSRMLGVKTKEVMDELKPAISPKMPFYDLHNAYTFSAQKSLDFGETKTIQERTMRMVGEVSSLEMMPFYDALFGEMVK